MPYFLSQETTNEPEPSQVQRHTEYVPKLVKIVTFRELETIRKLETARCYARQAARQHANDLRTTWMPLFALDIYPTPPLPISAHRTGRSKTVNLLHTQIDSGGHRNLLLPGVLVTRSQGRTGNSSGHIEMSVQPDSQRLKHLGSLLMRPSVSRMTMN